jgi:hypothetical protein
MTIYLVTESLKKFRKLFKKSFKYIEAVVVAQQQGVHRSEELNKPRGQLQ